jgi:hypothetical protein
MAGLFSSSLEIADHPNPRFRMVMGAVDAHAIHAVPDEVAYELIVRCSVRGHGHHDSDSSAWRRGTEEGVGIGFQQLGSFADLSHSAAEKLARFLLDLSANHDEAKGEVKLTLSLTHEEIAQMIGASRETVTRLFADFKKKQFLHVKGSTVIIKNKVGLESVVSP